MTADLASAGVNSVGVITGYEHSYNKTLIRTYILLKGVISNDLE